MKLLQFIWKYRKLSFLLTASALLFTIALQAWGFGHPLIWAVEISAFALVIYHARVRLEQKRTRNALAFGRQLVHNAAEDGIPSNRVWDNAVYRMQQREHAEDEIKGVRYIKSADLISIDWTN